MDTYLPVGTPKPGTALALAYTRDQSVEVQRAVASAYPWRPDLGSRISEAGTCPALQLPVRVMFGTHPGSGARPQAGAAMLVSSMLATAHNARLCSLGRALQQCNT